MQATPPGKHSGGDSASSAPCETPISRPCSKTRCTGTGHARSRPPGGCARRSTRREPGRDSGLPSRGEENSPARRVEAVHQLVFLVEGIAQSRADEEPLVNVVARGEIDQGV